MFDVSMKKPAVGVNVIRSKESDTRVDLPGYETAGAAGMDVRANFKIETREKGVTIEPGQRALIPTGLIVEVPEGFEMQVRPRSGLALKSGITVANAPGTVDSDYRGELGIILINHGDAPFHVSQGDRVAQLVLAPVVQVEWHELDSASTTLRGKGGFGSTGM